MEDKWAELANMLQQPLNQAIVLALMLGYFVFCHSVLVASGARRVKKQKMAWSWERFWSDVKDRVLAVYVLFGLIIGCDMVQWLMPLILGVEPNSGLMAVLNASLIIALPFVAGTAELYRAARNTIKLWGWTKNLKLLGLNESDLNLTDKNYQSIVDDVGNFVETLTRKTVREQLIEDGIDVEAIEGKIVGKGSGNTYPDPYRSAAKDSLIDPSTCYNRECVSYTAWKICEDKGSWPVRTGGMNAKLWVDRLPSWGYKLVSAPKKGGKYIGVLTSGTYGHVVWFEKYINNSTVQISEYNYADAGNYGLRNIPVLTYIWFEIEAPSGSTAPTTPVNNGDSNGFEKGDTVLPVKYVDYNGKRLRKTKDYYTITDIEGNRAVLSWENSVYAAVNTDNLKHVEFEVKNPEPVTSNTSLIKKGDTVFPTRLVDYVGTPLTSYDPSYMVIDLNGDRAVLQARGQIWAAMNVKDLKKV